MKLALKIWRQNNASSPGKMVDYTVDNIEPDMSFLEMLDILNDELIVKGEDTVAFDHDRLLAPKRDRHPVFGRDYF